VKSGAKDNPNSRNPLKLVDGNDLIPFDGVSISVWTL
jgi:hypothetical protein